jgi:hypothetical protein
MMVVAYWYRPGHFCTPTDDTQARASTPTPHCRRRESDRSAAGPVSRISAACFKIAHGNSVVLNNDFEFFIKSDDLAI